MHHITSPQQESTPEYIIVKMNKRGVEVYMKCAKIFFEPFPTRQLSWHFPSAHYQDLPIGKKTE